jgi:hypothetical protein
MIEKYYARKLIRIISLMLVYYGLGGFFFMLVALAAFSVSFRASAQKRCAPVVAPVAGIAAAGGRPVFSKFCCLFHLFAQRWGWGVSHRPKIPKVCGACSDTPKQGFCVGVPSNDGLYQVRD